MGVGAGWGGGLWGVAGVGGIVRGWGWQGWVCWPGDTTQAVEMVHATRLCWCQHHETHPTPPHTPHLPPPPPPHLLLRLVHLHWARGGVDVVQQHARLAVGVLPALVHPGLATPPTRLQGGSPPLQLAGAGRGGEGGGRRVAARQPASRNPGLTGEQLGWLAAADPAHPPFQPGPHSLMKPSQIHNSTTTNNNNSQPCPSPAAAWPLSPPWLSCTRGRPSGPRCCGTARRRSGPGGTAPGTPRRAAPPPSWPGPRPPPGQQPPALPKGGSRTGGCG